MAGAQFDPEEVIDLISSDGEPSPPTKKRPLEDSPDPTSPNDAPSSLRNSKRARTDPPSTADPEPQGQEPLGEESLSAEEGEIEEDEPQDAVGDTVATEAPSKGESPPTTRSNQTKPSKPTAGWNPTISKTVVRTSLGEPAVPVPTDAPVFQHNSLTFKLPHLSAKEGSWVVRFNDWVRGFHGANSKLTHAITPALTQSAYLHYIDNFSALKPKKRRSAKQIAKEVESTGSLAALLESIASSNASRYLPTAQTTNGSQPPQPSKQAANEGARKRKSSRASSASMDTALNRAEDPASDSDVEYEPSLSKSERTGEAIPRASGSASLVPDAAHANGNSKSLLPKGQESAAASTTFQDGPIMTKRNVPTGSVALEQQRRYFPSASDPTQMCLLCGRGTHLAANCSTLICSSCGSLEHPDLCCPSRERCNKCRQLGHRAVQCTEKLALTKDEGLACGVCNSSDHLEKDCTQVWRSFHPEAGTINKVVFIPASCSMCGSNTHFSADCKRRRGGDVPNPTWSVKNRDQYVDPDCGSSSIEETGGGQENARTTRAPELKIRGHAARTTNIHYSSDDSEVEFLGHRPVKQRAPLGQIRMASNIQMPQNATSRNDRPPRGNNGRGQHQLPPPPPLPRGPPPSGPPQRQGSFGYPPPPGVPTCKALVDSLIAGTRRKDPGAGGDNVVAVAAEEEEEEVEAVAEGIGSSQLEVGRMDEWLGLQGTATLSPRAAAQHDGEDAGSRQDGADKAVSRRQKRLKRGGLGDQGDGAWKSQRQRGGYVVARVESKSKRMDEEA
ncbi:hypothetical protein G7Z17_g10901 [Cylindrodendrum hubeiense]|uniref:CCHC-type domain-containing protein n=1 Tax=Cylindrodendrum hubeiense TaxID=595255 RepID=A0A9P5H197_9HYPO|nr:hypothetical protein G7Z17_g10901 [Cylindrodendrum hubeiense]